jgi:hypothetical protein
MRTGKRYFHILAEYNSMIQLYRRGNGGGWLSAAGIPATRLKVLNRPFTMINQKTRQVLGIFLIIALLFLSAHFFLHSGDEENGHCLACQILQNGTIAVLSFQITVLPLIAPLSLTRRPWLFRRKPRYSFPRRAPPRISALPTLAS